MPVSQLFLTTAFHSHFHFSLRLYLSSLISVLSPAPSHNWKQTTGLGLRCGPGNEDHTGAMNCSTAPLPLLLLVGHGNLTNNMNDWRDKGGERSMEEDRKPCPQGVRKAETERRLWWSWRNRGMKTWTMAMQLNFGVN